METFRKYDNIRRGVWFSLEIMNDEFLALISTDALNIHFKASDRERDQITAYHRNRAAIEQVARRKLLGGAQRPVTLGVADF